MRITGFVALAVMLFIGLAVWWLESRFGSNVALTILGGTLGIICFSFGALLSYGISRATLGAATDFNRDLANTERYRQMSSREYARGEREAFNARAKLDVLDAKRIEQIAQQRAGLLLDLERQKLAQQAESSRWAVVDDDDDAGDFQRYQ